MNQLAVINIEDVRKRTEIEERYKRNVREFQEQCSLSIRLIRADFKMKCFLVKELRNAELLALGDQQ